MTLEYQRYGRNKSTLVNAAYLSSGEYRNKFDHITDDPAVNRILYAKAKEMLLHRSGTMVEDMYWFDRHTGEIAASVTDQAEAVTEQIVYTKAVRKAISSRPGLIAMHTHPQSLPPSASDFNAAYQNQYSVSLVLCHDGKIFQYWADQTISERMYIAYLQSFMKDGFPEYDAQWKALENLKRTYRIDFWEVLP